MAHSEQRKANIAAGMKKFYELNPERKEDAIKSMKLARQRHPEAFIAANKNRIYVPRVPTSILDVSSRTVSKILKRIGLGCSRCGWNEAVCDIHHIHGKKIPNPDAHSNLVLLCPNCHRVVHKYKITTGLISLTEYIGDRWKEAYFG